MLSQAQTQEIADIAAKLSRSMMKGTKNGAKRILEICAGDGVQPSPKSKNDDGEEA